MERLMKEVCVPELEIIKNNIIKPLWHQGTPLFSINASKSLLTFCLLNKIGVLGMEGFYIDEKNITPEMDCIADFSPLIELNKDNFYEASVKSAQSFIELIICENNIEIDKLLIEFELTSL